MGMIFFSSAYRRIGSYQDSPLHDFGTSMSKALSQKASASTVVTVASGRNVPSSKPLVTRSV